MEVAHFPAVMDTLAYQDDIKVEVANFEAVIGTLVDQDIKVEVAKPLCSEDAELPTWPYLFQE